ncbi:MAG: hypothetical protein LBJ77_02880 [Holosporales bacterium]|jgi:hypothetical protein|nr:hypothetical protein [Holosporales bacterium]
MVYGVKNTLIICLTILVACVLFISYNEYTNRYALVVTQDNSLYIFDKKSTVLNKCSDKGCSVIETKLPAKVFFPISSDNTPSRLFGSEKRMADDVVEAKAEKKEDSETKTEGAQEEKKSPGEETKISESSTETNKPEENKKAEEEFVE